MSDRPIYLDYNATTPIAPEVAAAMRPYLGEVFGNPSSRHPYGLAARYAVEEARGKLAALIGADPSEIVFTGSGTESNNTVLMGIARTAGSGHIITTAIEHPAVLEPLAALELEGFRVTRLPVDARGRVDPDLLAAHLTPDTILVTIMHANNEVGTLEPIVELARVARDAGVPFHTDAAQSVGKIPVNVRQLGVDFLSIAGHKLYAPKGVGALFVRDGLSLPPLLRGGSQENGRRAGTENVLEIVGLGAAAALTERDLDATSSRTRSLRDRLWSRLGDALDDLRWNGDSESGLPNTLNVAFGGVDAGSILDAIEKRIAASTGAACHSDGVRVSPVLAAMGVPMEYARGALRFSLGRMTTLEEVEEAAVVVARAVGSLRLAGASGAEPTTAGSRRP